MRISRDCSSTSGPGALEPVQWELAVYRAHLDRRTVPAGPARSVPAGQGRGHWRTFDPTAGFPGGVVKSIIQDRAGDLWFGVAEGGLVRYDGRDFHLFTEKDGLPANSVGCLLEDRSGRLWFSCQFSGSHAGHLCCYDGRRPYIRDRLSRKPL